jgi:predicted DNA-binding protein
MRTLSITLSDELYQELKQTAAPGKISKFVSEAVYKKLRDENESFSLAYREAACDKEREDELKEWDAIELEGWGEFPPENTKK